MFKALTPIIGIIIAVGLFFTYIQPTFTEVKAIQDETAQYAEAITKATELQGRINKLKQEQQSISPANLERLEAMLPNRVDEVAVLGDMDALAASHHLVLADIKVGTQKKDEGAQQPGSAPGVPANGDTPTAEVPIQGQYITLDIDFSVKGSYDDFRAFLQDVERSLVFMEIHKISFTQSSSNSESNSGSFTMSIRLFSLITSKT